MKFIVQPRYENVCMASKIFSRPLSVAIRQIFLIFHCSIVARCLHAHKYACARTHTHTCLMWLGSLPAQPVHVLPCRSVRNFLLICPNTLRWGSRGWKCLAPSATTSLSHIAPLLPSAPPGVKWMMKLQSGVMLWNVTALFDPGNQRASSPPPPPPLLLLLPERWMI